MWDQINSLREHYATLSDDELQNIVVTGGLRDDAREILNQELRRRGITDVSEYQKHLDHVDQLERNKKQQTLQRKEKAIRLYSRTGYGISLFGILTGLFILYVRKDHTNGVGILVASVMLLPLVWISAMVRRLVWRFLLRP